VVGSLATPVCGARNWRWVTPRTPLARTGRLANGGARRETAVGWFRIRAAGSPTESGVADEGDRTGSGTGCWAT